MYEYDRVRFTLKFVLPLEFIWKRSGTQFEMYSDCPDNRTSVKADPQ